jgi:hypothetical protein
MPIIRGQITKHGAVIDLLLGVSRNRRLVLERNHLAVPDPVAVRAVIDTGSALSGFRSSAFQQLQIQPFTQIPVRTPSTRPGQPHWTDQYDVSITLVSGTTVKVFESVHAIMSDDFNPADEEGIEAIFGRDVLDRCVMNYYGAHQYFEVAF